MNVAIVVLDMDHYKYFFSDRNEYESLIVLDKKFSVVREIAKRLYKGKLPPEWIYKITLRLMSQQADIRNTDVLVVTDLAQIKLPRGFVRWLKTQYPNLKTVMMFYNKVSTLYGIPGNISLDEFPDKDIMLPFDKIFTYDAEEAEQFGFEYFTAISNVSRFISGISDKPLSDVFYCGSVKAAWRKERFDGVDQVYRYLTANNVKCDFCVVFGKKVEMPACEYATHDRISYLEMVKRTINSRCILEIASDGKNGITERFYNALMYNKRFITNNPSVLQHPYYNPAYMKVFEKTEEIDIDWLLSDEPVDYHYDGKYTPAGLYDILCKTF